MAVCQHENLHFGSGDYYVMCADWTPQANSLRWFAEIRAKFNL